MIVLFEGFPGSGKTYDAVRKILSNLKMGRRVLTNIDGLDNEQQRQTIQHYTDLDDYQIKDLLVYLNDSDIKRFWKFVNPGDIIVIDEAQDHFNSRDWQKDSNRQFAKWASSHRHNGNDLFLITPNQTRIEKSVRDMVEWFYRYKKMNMFGSLLQKGYIRFAFYGQDIEPIGKKICKYDTAVFLCYKSFFESDLKEHATMKHANILKHPIILSVPVVLCLMIYFLSQSSLFSGDIFGAKAFQESHQASLTPAPDEPVQSSPPANVTRPQKQVIGYVNGKPIYRKGNGFEIGS